MKCVLQICVEGNTGSTGRIAEEIGLLVMDKGWRSIIAFGRFPRPSKSELIRIGSYWDVYLHGILTRLTDRHCLGSRRATRSLVKKIEEISPDIIHLHHLHGYYINIKILFEYLKSKDIPVVWTFHDCWSFTGHCIYFDYVGCDKWRTVCFKCPQKKEYPGSLFIDRSRKNFYLKKTLFTSLSKMVIIPVSYWLENNVRESFLRNTRIETIHNGIDTSVFSPRDNADEVKKKYNVNGQFLILGVASPWSHRKGLYDFIRLSQLLTEEERIILVGLSRKQMKKLPKNIIGIQKTEDRQQLVDLYSASDVFVNPTLEDNFPTTNIEAIACGTPVITYKTGGSVEAISEDTGFIVEKGDVTGLYQAVQIVRKRGNDYYLVPCRNRALEFFSKQERFNEYLKIYEGLTKNDN